MPVVEQPPLPQQVAQPTPGQIIRNHQREAPVDVLAIAKDLGVNVWGTHQLPPNISGKIFRDSLNGGPSGFSISVNTTEAWVRQRFTVAHEIAHFILHRHLLEQKGALADDTMYRSGLSTAEETAANRLAADILMPFPLIQAVAASGINDVLSLANRFQVSQFAMKIRLGIPT